MRLVDEPVSERVQRSGFDFSVGNHQVISLRAAQRLGACYHQLAIVQFALDKERGDQRDPHVMHGRLGQHRE